MRQETKQDGSQPLRDRQETFCQLYSTGIYSASEAFRLAGYSHVGADGASARMLVKVSIKVRIAHIQAERAKKREITAESLADEYDEARQVGKDTQQASSMVSATSGKARLYGLDKQVIESQDTHKALSTTEADEAREYAEFKRWKADRGRVVGIRDIG